MGAFIATAALAVFYGCVAVAMWVLWNFFKSFEDVIDPPSTRDVDLERGGDFWRGQDRRMG